MEKNILNIYSDGGSRGNPGPAAVGVVVMDSNNKIIYEISKTIGVATNNVAEYRGVIEALKLIKEKQISVDKVNFYLDSLVVNNQLAEIFKIKIPHLKDLFLMAHAIIRELKISVTFTHIRRELNTRADFLVNQAFDNPTKT